MEKKAFENAYRNEIHRLKGDKDQARINMQEAMEHRRQKQMQMKQMQMQEQQEQQQRMRSQNSQQIEQP